MPVFLTYVALGGLNNQLYTHLNMLGLARALNATLAVAPAQRRNSFEIKDDAETHFSEDAIETLLDLDAMAAYWQPKGVRIASKVGIWCCRGTHSRIAKAAEAMSVAVPEHLTSLLVVPCNVVVLSAVPTAAAARHGRAAATCTHFMVAAPGFQILSCVCFIHVCSPARQLRTWRSALDLI